MTLLVDTSVWSHSLRRDGQSALPQVGTLRQALQGEEIVVTTGLVLQELLQGFTGPRARRDIIERFAALPLVHPNRQDHVDAADLRDRFYEDNKVRSRYRPPEETAGPSRGSEQHRPHVNTNIAIGAAPQTRPQTEFFNGIGHKREFTRHPLCGVCRTVNASSAEFIGL